MTTSNELEPRVPAGLPVRGEVTQAGQHNTNIAYVGTANMPVFMLQSSGGNSVDASPIQFDDSCYNLFVIAGEDFTTDRFFIDPTRALTEYTCKDLQQRYRHLQPNDLEDLKRYPAMFMAENGDMGRARPNQHAHWGAVTSIRVQDNGIRIGFQKIHSFPQQKLNENNYYFGIRSHGRASELNRTHWALKKVNLFEAFTDAGINHLPFAIGQGGVR